MDRALLDTDIYSEVLKRKHPTVALRATDYRQQFGRLTISVIAVLEVVKGLHKVGREDRVQLLIESLSGIEVLPLDTNAAALAGRIYADLERTGQPVGRADPMAAAIALRHNRTLVTGNTEHFERIRKLGYDLRLDDWRR